MHATRNACGGMAGARVSCPGVWRVGRFRNVTGVGAGVGVAAPLGSSGDRCLHDCRAGVSGNVAFGAMGCLRSTRVMRAGQSSDRSAREAGAGSGMDERGAGVRWTLSGWTLRPAVADGGGTNSVEGAAGTRGLSSGFESSFENTARVTIRIHPRNIFPRPGTRGTNSQGSYP